MAPIDHSAALTLQLPFPHPDPSFSLPRSPSSLAAAHYPKTLTTTVAAFLRRAVLLSSPSSYSFPLSAVKPSPTTRSGFLSLYPFFSLFSWNPSFFVAAPSDPIGAACSQIHTHPLSDLLPAASLSSVLDHRPPFPSTALPLQCYLNADPASLFSLFALSPSSLLDRTTTTQPPPELLSLSDPLPYHLSAFVRPPHGDPRNHHH